MEEETRRREETRLTECGSDHIFSREEGLSSLLDLSKRAGVREKKASVRAPPLLRLRGGCWMVGAWVRGALNFDHSVTRTFPRPNLRYSPIQYYCTYITLLSQSPTQRSCSITKPPLFTAVRSIDLFLYSFAIKGLFTGKLSIQS